MFPVVKPILATNNPLVVVSELIFGNIAAPQAKVPEPSVAVAAPQAKLAELSVSTVGSSTVHP